MNFSIAVKGKGIQLHQIISMHLLAGFTLIALGACNMFLKYYGAFWKKENLHFASATTIILFISGIALVALVIFRQRMVRNKKWNLILRISELSIFIFIASALLFFQWYQASVFLFILVAGLAFSLYTENKKQNFPMLEVDRHGIKLPKWAGKTFLNWTEVENLICRHGILTIDCVDNKLYQYQMEQEKENKALELFAQNLIKEHIDQREADW